MMTKPVEYWIALCAASLYVFMRSSDKPLLNRVTLTGISAGLGFSMTPDLAVITGRPEILTLVVATSLIYLVLDFASALFSDRALLVDMVKRLVRK